LRPRRTAEPSLAGMRRLAVVMVTLAVVMVTLAALARPARAVVCG
jgi:hypothetical protein